jgi:hypothetical protein
VIDKGANRVGVIFILPEDGNRSSLRNVLFKKNIGRWTKSKNVILSYNPTPYLAHIEFKICHVEVNFNVTTRRYIPEDFKLHTRRRENLKSHIQISR